MQDTALPAGGIDPSRQRVFCGRGQTGTGGVSGPMRLPPLPPALDPRVASQRFARVSIVSGCLPEGRMERSDIDLLVKDVPSQNAEVLAGVTRGMPRVSKPASLLVGIRPRGNGARNNDHSGHRVYQDTL